MNCQKCIEKIANIAKITNLTRIANCSKTLLQIFVAILEKIGLIEIACRNLVFKSAKIAKVTRNFVAPKNTQITIARIARITTYIAKDLTYKEKGIEGPKNEVGKFRKNRKTNKIY